MTRLAFIGIAVAAVVASGAWPAGPRAAPPPVHATPGADVQSAVGTGEAAELGAPRRVSTAVTSRLPFSGLDVGLLLGVGLVLLLVGEGLSRLTAGSREERQR